MEKTFTAKLDFLDEMITFIKDGAIGANFDKKNLNKIHLACEEILINIINYAYTGKKGKLKIKYSINNGEKISITIIDWGIKFNPLTKSDPDINVPIEKRKIGGLGIFMVKKIMDTVYYKREGDMNIITMIKNK